MGGVKVYGVWGKQRSAFLPPDIYSLILCCKKACLEGLTCSQKLSVVFQ